MSRRLLSCIVVSIAALIASAAPAGASVGVGHSGFFWGNPVPQGEDLNAVDFSGARGYAVGGFGTVVRSDDGGKTWAGVGSGTTFDLSRVQTIGPNSVVVAGGCSLRRSDDAGATFTRLPFSAREDSCTSGVAAMTFPSSAVGYLALGNGTVLRTADGGRSFSQRTGVPGTAVSGGSLSPSDIRFTGPDTGVAVAGGRVYRTTDGANSWTAVATAAAKVGTVRFLDALNGVAVGTGGTFLTTADGGATFASHALTGEGAGKDLTGVTCSNAATCVMTTGANSVVRTADGGDTSTLVSASDRKIAAAAFATGPRVSAVGEQGTSVISDDSGADFSPVSSRLSIDLLGSIRSVDGGRAYAPATDGRVARTLDGGRSWTSFGVSSAGDVRDVSFPTPAIGFALDTEGSLLRTDNTGESWRILDTGSPAAANAVVALDARRVVLIGPKGVRRSTNGGASFGASKSKAVSRASLTDVDRIGGSLVTWGTKSAALSRNGGTTWSKIRVPKGKIRQLDFVSARSGYLLQDGGRLLKTASGGRHWSVVDGTATRAIDSVSFSDAKRGYAVQSASGTVLRTQDGGRSWAPELIGRQAIGAVAAASSGAAYALSASDELFATTSGGRLGRASALSFKLSTRRLAKAGTVRLVGRLRPARGGARLTVIVQTGAKYKRVSAIVASGGTFNARLKIARTSLVTVQWRGDDRVDGDGTAPAKVTVKKKRRKR